MRFDFDAFAAECPSAILVVGARGDVLFVNRAMASLLGYGLPELARDGVGPLLPPRLHPPAGSSWASHFVESSGESRRLLWPLLHRSGTEIESEWTVLSGHDPAGHEAIQLVVSQRQPPYSAPAKGTSVAQVHQLIFENAPTGIFHFDARGVVTASNERFIALLGSTRARVIGLAIPTLPNKDIVATLHKALAGELATYDGIYTSATGGKTVWVQLTMAPIFDDARQVTGGVGLVLDVTETRRAAEMVARAERLASLGTLAAGVAHEVQNPLAYVITNLELALRGVDALATREGMNPASVQELRAVLTAAREGATRVASIARDLKTFARSDEALRGPVNIASVIESALKLTDNQLRHRARVERRIEPIPTVWASESRLVQLFVNLLMNAAEAIPEGNAEANVITIRARAMVDGRLRIEVEDTGRGIAPADAVRIFEPFWTAKATGMGLGLAICLGIVSSLHGEIFVDADRAPASGARFVVILPSGEARRSSPSSAPLPPVTTAVGAVRGRVLIVDDEQRLADALRLALSADHDVQVATRGKRALEILLADPGFDVVLCDLLLPDLSGADLYEEIALKHPELARRFIFLTGGAFSARTREFLQRVENPRLDKPFDLMTLERLVNEQVALGRSTS